MNIDFYGFAQSIESVIASMRRAEERGFRAAWSTELHRSPFVALSAAAGVTSRIGLGTAIVWAFTRTPMSMALTALDLDELTDGRFILGLGSGVRRLNTDWHDVEFDRPVRRLKETVETIRTFIATSHLGDPIEIEGELVSMNIYGYKRPFPPRRTRIPIYLASVGPQMTRLTGEVADGWIGHELGSPKYLAETIIPNLEAGLSRAGRNRTSLDIVHSGVCVIHPDRHEALRRTAGLVAFYASVRTYTPFFAFHGFEAEALEIQERFRAGDISGMIEATPDEMVDAVTLSGTPDRAQEKLEAFRGVVDGVKLSAPTHFVTPEVTSEAQAAILEILGPG